MKKFISAALFLSSLSAHAEVIPGQVLLDVFEKSCPSSGEWTQAALNDSRSLMAVIDTIAKDEDCKSLTGALSQLATLNDQVSELANMSETKKQIAAYDAQERDLLIQISNSSSQGDIDAMTANLRTIQMGRAGLLGRENAEKEMSGTSTVLALSKAVQTANSSFSQIAANQRCQEKAPSLITTATSLLSSIGGAVSAVNPALGLGLQAGSAFIGTAAEQFRTARYNRQIRQIAEGSTAFMGYKCALETFNNRWCEMEEARAFLKYKTELRTSDVNQELRGAIKLNDREIPVILDWLLQVKSGVEPQNDADGGRQSYALSRKNLLEVIEVSGIAHMNDKSREYEAVSNNPQAQYALIRSIVNNLVPVHREYGVQNPLRDLYPAGYLPYYLLGVDINEPSIQANGNWVELNNWKNPIGVKPTLESVRMKFLELVAEARVNVERQLNEILRPDPGITLGNAYVPSSRHKISPMDSLSNLIIFLEKNPPGPGDEAFLRIYRGTLEKLKVIHSATEDAVITDGLSIGDDVERESLEKILRAANLTYGTVLIQSRLELLVRISVLRLLRESSPQDQVIVAQLLASDRFMATLSQFTGKSTVGEIGRDIQQAMDITSSNANSFVKGFGKILTRQLQRLVKEEREAGPYLAEIKRNSRSQLCHLLLSAQKVTEHVDVRYCVGLKLGPITKGAPETAPLTVEDFSKELGSRACRIHDYNLAEKIYLEWNLKDKSRSVRRY